MQYLKYLVLLPMFGGCWPAFDNRPGKAEKSPMRIELDAFSGRPNPTWSLTDEQTGQFFAKFKLLKKSDSQRALYDGLGYRGFKVAGFQDYDGVTVWADIIEARRGGTRYQWLDESKSLERYLLETSK